ncbi:MAG: helix-turn-helix domain-containing protein [Oscillospiraceae bacterium]|nr:helix-turn-helix domain-containing protein [Oscillospiraceae bacterium]
MLQLRLLELRKGKDLTQADIAGMLSITPQAYSMYETGKHHINNEVLCLLADYYKVTTDYILGRQDNLPSFLDEDERSVIARYRTLDERGRASVANCLDFECARTPKAAKPK